MTSVNSYLTNHKLWGRFFKRLEIIIQLSYLSNGDIRKNG